MKIPTMLLGRILLDEGLQTNLATTRDLQTIEDRFKHEGMSFLTITLPTLDDALLQGLTRGFLTPASFMGFRPHRGGGMLPAFMHGFFRKVFDEDGLLLDQPCIASIRAIRQVSRLFKKVELPCSPARIKSAFERYQSNDEGISGLTDSYAGYGRIFDLISSYLWSDLEILSGGLYCSPGIFGSGSTANREKFNERHSIKRWPQRGDESFPASYHACSREDDRAILDGLKYLSIEEEDPVRVVQVPKTLKAPRTISVEPSYMMLRQQSIARPLMVLLEEGFLGFKSIRFSSQEDNKDLARVGSTDGGLSTIDLSDASDLVSNDLVKRMFKTCPTFLNYVQDCRTSSAKMPDGSVINLRKYASMGSAMCFPIEAMFFYTIILCGMLEHSGRAPSKRLLSSMSKDIAVYGDDIIVPTVVAEKVMCWLEAFGLKVNHNKSFTTGFFRESCGGDYYRGQDVTPVYVRQLDDFLDTRKPRTVSAYVSLSNQFYMKGLWHASQYIRDFVEKSIGRLETTVYPVGCLTWTSVFLNTGLAYSSTISGYVVRGYQLVARRQVDGVRDIRGGMLISFARAELSNRLATLRRIGVETNDDASADVPHVGNARGGSFSGEVGVLGHSSPPRKARSAISGDSHWESSWLQHIRTAESERIQNANPLGCVSGIPTDFLTSVRPYALKMKRRLVPVRNTGLSW